MWIKLLAPTFLLNTVVRALPFLNRFNDEEDLFCSGDVC
jgi:hypothetical protein